MAVDEIISEIAALDWARVAQTPRGKVYQVCYADEEDWKAFMDSEAPETKCGKMEWIEGKVVLVELPWHDEDRITFRRLRSEILCAIIRHMTHAAVDAYLHPSLGGSTPRQYPYYEADLSYGPTPQAGGILPPGIQWRDWDTLKIEIGYYRGWGHGPGLLDWKASQWSKVPGVNYILCVALLDNLAGATYKLYTVLHRDRRLPLEVPTRVEAPRTVVRLNSRLLLGLAPRARLPRQPSVPARVSIDLFKILEVARSRF